MRDTRRAFEVIGGLAASIGALGALGKWAAASSGTDLWSSYTFDALVALTGVGSAMFLMGVLDLVPHGLSPRSVAWRSRKFVWYANEYLHGRTPIGPTPEARAEIVGQFAEFGHPEQPSSSTDKLRADLREIKRTVPEEGLGDLFAESSMSRVSEPGDDAKALRRSNDRDRSHWRDQILSLGHPLIRRCENTLEDTPEFPSLRDDVCDYVAAMRGPAIGKFNAGGELMSAADEKRLLRDGGTGDFRAVVESYVSLFETDSAGNAAARALSQMTMDEKRDTVQGLLDRGAALRTIETNSRGPSERDLAGTPLGWKKVNAWLDEVQAFLEVHFASEVYRVSYLGKLTVSATTAQTLQVIDEALKPLHNCRNELAKP